MAGTATGSMTGSTSRSMTGSSSRPMTGSSSGSSIDLTTESVAWRLNGIRIEDLRPRVARPLLFDRGIPFGETSLQQQQQPQQLQHQRPPYLPSLPHQPASSIHPHLHSPRLPHPNFQPDFHPHPQQNHPPKLHLPAFPEPRPIYHSSGATDVNQPFDTASSSAASSFHGAHFAAPVTSSMAPSFHRSIDPSKLKASSVAPSAASSAASSAAPSRGDVVGRDDGIPAARGQDFGAVASFFAPRNLCKILSLPVTPDLSAALSLFQAKNFLCDVILHFESTTTTTIKEDGSLSIAALAAHKVVLAATSPYFHRIFSSPESTPPSTSTNSTTRHLHLPHPITFAAMKLILDWMYGREVGVEAVEAEGVAEAAKVLGIECLPLGEGLQRQTLQHEEPLRKRHTQPQHVQIDTQEPQQIDCLLPQDIQQKQELEFSQKNLMNKQFLIPSLIQHHPKHFHPTFQEQHLQQNHSQLLPLLQQELTNDSLQQQPINPSLQQQTFKQSSLQQHSNQSLQQQYSNQTPKQQHSNQTPKQQHSKQTPKQQHSNQTPKQQHSNQTPLQQAQKQVHQLQHPNQSHQQHHQDDQLMECLHIPEESKPSSSSSSSPPSWDPENLLREMEINNLIPDAGRKDETGRKDENGRKDDDGRQDDYDTDADLDVTDFTDFTDECSETEYSLTTADLPGDGGGGGSGSGDAGSRSKKRKTKRKNERNEVDADSDYESLPSVGSGGGGGCGGSGGSGGSRDSRRRQSTGKSGFLVPLPPDVDPRISAAIKDSIFHCPQPQCDYQLGRVSFVSYKDPLPKWIQHCASHLLKKHGVETANVFKCFVDGCGFAAVVKSDLDNHARLKHEVYKELTCAPCQKSFATKIAFDYHMLMSHDDANKMAVECDVCQRQLPSKAALFAHTRSAHAEGQTLRCDSCDFQTGLRYLFHRHMFASHKILCPGVKLYTCEICDSFSSTIKMEVKRHMISHTHVKNFPCQDCGKKYKTRAMMETHWKRCHSGLKKVCQVCGAEYKHDTGLRDHIKRAHTEKGAHNFKCPYCPHSSFLSGNCRKHVMRVHAGMEVRYIDLRREGENHNRSTENQNNNNNNNNVDVVDNNAFTSSHTITDAAESLFNSNNHSPASLESLRSPRYLDDFIRTESPAPESLAETGLPEMGGMEGGTPEIGGTPELKAKKPEFETIEDLLTAFLRQNKS